jgi:hypothetical protein
MRSSSSREKHFAAGFIGLLRMTAFVRGENARASASASIAQSGGVTRTSRGMPPARFTSGR